MFRKLLIAFTLVDAILAALVGGVAAVSCFYDRSNSITYCGWDAFWRVGASVFVLGMIASVVAVLGAHILTRDIP